MTVTPAYRAILAALSAFTVLSWPGGALADGMAKRPPQRPAAVESAPRDPMALLRSTTVEPALAGAPVAATVRAPADAPIATRPKAAQTFQTMLALTVDGDDMGEFEADVSLDGAVWLDAARLAATLKDRISADLGSQLTTLAEKGKSTPSDLASKGLSVRYDAANVSLAIETPLDGAPVRRVSAQGRAIPDPRTSIRAARLAGATNVTLAQATRGGAREPLAATVDGFVSVGGDAGMTLSYAGAWTESGTGRSAWRRDGVTLSRDDFGRAIRYAAGDIEPRSYGFQSGPRLIGVSVARAYQDIRPFENITNSGQARFKLERDSTVTIETDGAPTVLRLKRGQYDLRDLAITPGANRVRVTAEDYAGLRTLAELSVWNDAALLSPGVTDFSIAAGKLSVSGETVGPLAYSGFVRRGLTQRLTAAVGIEGRGDDWLGQADATIGAPGAAIQLTAASSSVSGRQAFAGAGSVRAGLDLGPESRLAAYATAQYRQSGFGAPFGDTSGRVAGWDSSAGATYTRGVTTYSTTWSRYRSDRGARTAFDASVAHTVGRVTIGGGVSSSDGLTSKKELRARVALTVRTSVRGAPVVASATSTSAAARIDYSHGRGVGAWTAAADARYEQSAISAGASGSYEGNRFRGALAQTATWRDGDLSTSGLATVSSAIVFADGALAIARPVGRAFMIATRHPSLSSATAVIRDGASMSMFGVSDDKQPYRAKSGRLGAPVILLTPYMEERVDVAADNLPLGYDLGPVTSNIVAGYGKGYVVRLGRDAWRSALGTLVSPDGPVTNMRLAIHRAGSTDEPRAAFTNGAGRFYVDGLSEGRYTIMIDGRAVASFDIARTAPALTDVGVLHAPTL